MGVQSIDPAKCIWDAATLPPSAPDTFAPQAKERRQHKRIACRLGAELHIAGVEALVRGEITNLSEGGCFVAMSTLTEDKSRLKIIVWANEAKLAMQGVVASRRPGFGISIKFTEMPEDVRGQLQRFIQSRFAVHGR
jgi:c-di-GMP-binding flagellar brake protein YcgR